jgi:Bacterial Ig-like domain (group 2)
MKTRSFPAGIATAALATFMALLALACGNSAEEDESGSSGPKPPPPVYPVIEGPFPPFQRVAPGAPAEFEWHISWPGGGLPDYQAFSIGSPAASLESNATVRGGWANADRTVYRGVIQSGHPGGYRLQLQPSIAVPRSNIPLPWPDPALVLVAGGRAAGVAPYGSETTLAIGEHRPMSAWVGTEFIPYAGWSDDALSYAIDDPAVATVSADGVLVGVAPGTTELHLTAGAASATVAVTVADLPIGPPEPGDYLVTTVTPTLFESEDARGLGPLEAKVAVDRHGYPRIVMPLLTGTAERPLVLARWTGTGFGFEEIGAGWKRYDQAVTAVTDDGREWILVFDSLFRELYLLDRPAGTDTGGWRERRMPIGPDYGAGEEDFLSFDPTRAEARLGPQLAIRVDGDAVWVAYSTAFDVVNPYSQTTRRWGCPTATYLVRADADTVEPNLLEMRFRSVGIATQYPDCDALYDIRDRRLAILPGPEGSDYPGVLALQDAFRLYYHDGAGWAEANPADDGQPTYDLAPVLPVASADDWIRVTSPPAAALWAWKDADGAVNTVVPADAPPVAGQDGRYAGHAVGEADVAFFYEDGGLRLAVWPR